MSDNEQTGLSLYSKVRRTAAVALPVVYFTAAALFPSAMLFNLYNNNFASSHIVFSHVTVLALMLAVMGVLGFMILRQIAGGETALSIMTLFWVLFWNFRAVQAFLDVSYFVAVAAVGVLVLLVFVPLMFLRHFLLDFKPVFGTLSIVLIAMFLLNAAPGFHRNFTSNPAAGGYNVERMDLPIKRDFVVDPSLPSPDIYWIHLDGMISLCTFEYFFQDDKDWVRQELANRGFLIYEDARLWNAAKTSFGAAMLLSPSLYDGYFGPLLDSIDDGMLGGLVFNEGHRLMALDRVCIYYDILSHAELFAALLHAGYMVEGVNYWWRWWNMLDVRRVLGEPIGWFEAQWGVFLRTNLPFLLYQTVPFPFFLFHNSRPVYISVQGLDTEQMPNFSWIHYDHTHFSHWPLDGAPDGVSRDPTRIDLYPLAYAGILHSMLDAIDSILSENPNKVIVLQGDHGMHNLKTQEHLLEIGVPLDTVLELSFSVFSAVRIPAQYGGLDEPLNPLNISRVLVNRFVGENYALLP